MIYTVEDLLLAKKYAQAFINLFSSTLSHDSLVTIEQAYRFLQKDRYIIVLLSLPHLTFEQRTTMIHDFMRHFSLPIQLNKIMVLLLTHNRSFLIPPVLRYIMQLYKKHTNVLDFSIITAHQLSAENFKTIKQFLSQLTHKDIIYHEQINPALIAGIRLQSDEYVWEYSVRKQIKNIADIQK